MNAPLPPNTALPTPPAAPMATVTDPWIADLHEAASRFDHHMSRCLGHSATAPDPDHALAWTRLGAVWAGLSAALRDAALQIHHEEARTSPP